jgi:hypothetical protein
MQASSLLWTINSIDRDGILGWHVDVFFPLSLSILKEALGKS